MSGCYRGADAGFAVELRVDVDGPRATRRVSADYFRLRDATKTYIGSMRVDEPVVSITQTRVTIAGTGLFSWPTKNSQVSVTIPRDWESSGPAPAVLRHFASGGASGSAYVCAFESPNFRTVQLEEAREQAVTRFTSYDTGSLPGGGPARSLTLAAAFAEAGVELAGTGEPIVVETSGAGADAAWSDAELHAAMETSFSRWADDQQWAIWLLHAVTHENRANFGVMFDRHGLQRQGCAVFYDDLSPSNPEAARELLHVCVHELGHGFNLPHCWKPSLQPPLPSRPDARTWMNNPERFPGGRDAFWSKFGFAFDDLEIAHLRHAFRESVIMGGAPFAGRATVDRYQHWDSERQDHGLRLKLHAPRALAQGVPVTVGLELSATTREGRLVTPSLGPRPGTIDIAIRDSSGNESVFEPMLRHCRAENAVLLRASDAPIRDHAFIHYGKEGFPFEEPGRYRLRARYTARDGSLALSDGVSIDIRRPAPGVERDVVKLTYGNAEVGQLMCLVGSDADDLRGGNQTLRTIADRYPAHPVADIARLIRGANLTRRFKSIEPDGSVNLRDPDIARAASIVESVVDVAQLLRAPRGGRAAGPVVGAEVLPEIATLPGVSPAVDDFINSRRSEFNNALERARRAEGAALG